MGSFETGEENWIKGLGNLRNVIRQELIARQVNEHVAVIHPGKVGGSSV